MADLTLKLSHAADLGIALPILPPSHNEYELHILPDLRREFIPGLPLKARPIFPNIAPFKSAADDYMSRNQTIPQHFKTTPTAKQASVSEPLPGQMQVYAGLQVCLGQSCALEKTVFVWQDNMSGDAENIYRGVPIGLKIAGGK